MSIQELVDLEKEKDREITEISVEIERKVEQTTTTQDKYEEEKNTKSIEDTDEEGMYVRYLRTSKRKIRCRNEEEEKRQELIRKINEKAKIAESKKKQLEELQGKAKDKKSKTK